MKAILIALLLFSGSAWADCSITPNQDFAVLDQDGGVNVQYVIECDEPTTGTLQIDSSQLVLRSGGNHEIPLSAALSGEPLVDEVTIDVGDAPLVVTIEFRSVLSTSVRYKVAGVYSSSVRLVLNY
ncbi:TPA: hypothetical protein ACG4NT_000044 [Stenotrophomonas maltophilia]|uniref:hypothetical protein n=1 Tax=unclassified Stenotrophomonas TaxID=196198 RepID=UPI00244B1DD2|nr:MULTISPECIES: hypothetical protein [unclassified Stenotrophomonas]HDS1363585.1 hypothetical protein [Stenotrophomonas maltophilia]MDH0190163.1 hypothetical protein [Stenotrophomonas sp. GD04051]MDH0463931.1 hypothetical protein [Stenotrophomonas sp. GD03993]MDH0874553.1 hypothetical protein [Stenotrophomonas sp. GD03877]MDH2155162.1 hypothetical protein [Stenotrophomonas sp. GD03657]